MKRQLKNLWHNFLNWSSGLKFSIIFFLVIAFATISRLESKYVNNIDTVWFVLGILLIFIMLTIFGRDDDLFDRVRLFLSQGLKNKNISLTIMILTLVVFVPILLLILNRQHQDIFYHFFNFKETLDPKTFLAIWITGCGVLLTSLIYFKIDKRSSKYLQEYLEIAIDLINDAKTDQKILIIIPTIFLGDIEKLQLGKTFRNKLSNNSASIKYCLAFLNVSDAQIDDLAALPEKLNSSPDGQADVVNKIKEIERKYSASRGLLQLHITSLPENIDSKRTLELKNSHYRGLGVFLQKVKALNHVKTINLKYEIIDSHNRAFFAVVNLISGDFYLGNLKIVDYSIVHFHGERFKNEHLIEDIKDLFKSYIKRNISNDAELDKLTNFYN